MKKKIRFCGRTEEVLDTFHLRGRDYFVLERLSGRGAFRVFDTHAGPIGDYRVLHRVPKAKETRHQIEILRRIARSNRNFPEIVDFVQQGADLFLVFAWISGADVRSYLRAVRDRETPRPSVSEVVRLIRGLVHGISQYHRKANIIHGDISPANIVMSSGTKHFVLIDFGSAWPIERAVQPENDAFTRPYAAPERIAKHAAEDFRSDIFSVSVIAYELLTLLVPYDGLGGQAGIPEWAAKTADSYDHPSTLIATHNRLPRKTLGLLDDSISTGLKLHPDARFPTTSAWISAWDSLHFSLKKGSRLTRIDELCLSGIEYLMSPFRRKDE